MAVKIRLKRMGKIRAPHYRIVVADSRTKRDGRVIEEIGKYHPKEEPSLIDVDSERAQYWLGVGAQPSEAVEALLKVTGDWQRFKGEPGAEGTLKVKQQGKSKQEIFNEILKESGKELGGDAVTAKGSQKDAKKTGDSAAASAGSDKAGSDKAGSDKAGSDKAGSDKAGSDKAGSDKAGSDKAGSDKAGSDDAASNEVGAPRESGDAASAVES